MSISESEKNLIKSENSIRTGLITKGTTLTKNNSQALNGMVEDNAYSAVKELVANTVANDPDIAYGIYMTAESQPWVNASASNPSGDVTPGESLDDENSIWAAGLENFEYRLHSWNNEEFYEFVAPVIIDEEIMGFLRYGFTTETLKKTLAQEAEESKKSIIYSISILIGVGLLAIAAGFNGARSLAIKLSTPIKELKEAADTIAKGDYSSEVNVVTNDEVGLLANNFETMRATIKKKMQDLATLNATGEVLASLLDQHLALEQALKTMHSHCGVSQGSVFMINKNDELEVNAFYPPKKIEADQKPKKFKLGQGILGQSAQNRKIIFVPDTRADASFEDIPNNEGKALLCIPLLDKDVLIGVMNFSGDVDKVRFEDSDYEFASSIARLLVITIKNIRMREMIEEHNRTLELKIAERTAELQEKTNDILSMLQNMPQGLFTIMSGGIIHHEYAAYLETILDTKNIANRNFMDLLFSHSNLGSDKLDQINAAINALIDSDEMMFEFNSHLLPSEYNTLDNEGNIKKIIELGWDPIIFEEMIDKIMVTVRDVTEIKALQAEAENQKQELEIIGHILSVDAGKLNEFLESSYQFIDDCRALITQTPEKDLEVVATLFRNMHTVKGNARTYGFTFVTNSVHEVETTYDELRKNEHSVWDKERMFAELDLAEKDIKRYEQVAQNKLGRDTKGTNLGMATVDRDKIRRIIDSMNRIETSNLDESLKLCFNDAYHVLLEFEAKTIDKIISDVVESTQSLAEQLGKIPPKFEVSGDSVFINIDAHTMLNNIFMHVFRNSMDHGIESADIRIKEGKPEQGLISLDVIESDEFIDLIIKDDGRGLALEKIKAKAIENGIFTQEDAPTDQEVANLIFASGLSTAEQVTQVSGRGVGMEAVKKFLEKEGGQIDVILGDETKHAGFRQFSTRIRIPSKYGLVVASGLVV